MYGTNSPSDLYLRKELLRRAFWLEYLFLLLIDYVSRETSPFDIDCHFIVSYTADYVKQSGPLNMSGSLCLSLFI